MTVIYLYPLAWSFFHYHAPETQTLQTLPHYTCLIESFALIQCTTPNLNYTCAFLFCPCFWSSACKWNVFFSFWCFSLSIILEGTMVSGYCVLYQSKGPGRKRGYWKVEKVVLGFLIVEKDLNLRWVFFRHLSLWNEKLFACINISTIKH